MDDTRPLSGVSNVLAGRYRLLGPVGQGGMAEVQRAYDEQLDREVAVKILHARYSDDPSFLMRFRREARSAASLNHPNIVSVYDAGDAEGRPFIVMELVRGRSLRDLTREERVTAGRAIEIVGDSALALNYAHEHGLIHRDIKPGNILISHDGEVKVTDFGIARAVNAETITETAAVFGTAAYVAPEQAQGEAVDGRTDVYALGCVLYELLAGRQPFHADSPIALAYQHVSATPVPPSELSDESTPELDAITLKAMEKHPDDRYQSAREFNADLERARAGVPVTAPMAGMYGATQAVGRSGDQTVISSGGGYAPAQPAPADDGYDDDRYDDEEPRSRLGWWLLGILVLLALLAGGWFFWLNSTTDQVDTAELPDVTASTFASAEQTLNALGFDRVQQQDVQDAEAAENVVVAQDPEPTAAGEAIPVNTPIVLDVNTGPPDVSVPDVTGLTQQQAERRLREDDLELGEVDNEPSDEVEADQVIRSSPAAGRDVAAGSAVDIVLSEGSREAEVPDVTGRSFGDAELALQEACEPTGCFVAVRGDEQFSDTVDEGDVISQFPAAGTEALKGSEVQLTISRGPEETEPAPPPEPETTTIPDVVGDQQDSAVSDLLDAGLRLPDTLEQEPSDSVPEGAVIRTDPSAGSEVETGTTVQLMVSSGPPDSGGGDGGTGDGGDGGTGDGGDGSGEDGGGSGDGNGGGDDGGG